MLMSVAIVHLLYFELIFWKMDVTVCLTICSLKDMCSVGSHFIKSREEKRAIWVTFQFWRTLFILIFSEWFIKGNKISYRNIYITVISTTVVYHSFCQFTKYNLKKKKDFSFNSETVKGKKCWQAAELSGPQFPCLYTVKGGLERSLEYVPESWCLWTFLKPHLLIKFIY